MPSSALSAAYRVALFRRLETADSGQSELDQMYRLLKEGRLAAQQAQLGDLAAQFEGGQTALLEALRRTNHFLDWELEVMRLALTAGDVRAAYRYLQAHYTRLANFEQLLRRGLPLPIGVFIVVSIGLPLLGYADGLMSVMAATLLAVIPLSLLAALGLGLREGCQRWWRGTLPRWLIDRCYRLPGVGLLLSQQQSLHYFSHLLLCLESELPLAQSLRLATAALPYSTRRAAFEQLHASVAAGGRLSDGLRQSGALNGVQMRGVANGAGEGGAALAQRVLTESTRHTLVDGLTFWGRWLPQGVLLLLPLVLLANLWVMGFG